MATLVFLFIYAGVLVFAVGCVGRVVQYARAPIHLRWELYPVPHEAPERVTHGGSYFEQGDWWKKERRPNLAGELSFMIPEMLLLKGLWEYNRKLWYRSFPFHAGLYLLMGAAVLSTVGAVFGGSGLAGVLFAIARVCAWAGLALTTFGGVALFWRRLVDPELKNYTGLGDLLNVGGFAIACVLAIIGALSGSMPPLATLARALLTFDSTVRLPAATSAGLILGSVILGYIPYTHMAHFVAKYFTYHTIRWDDAPNNKQIAARVAEYLTYRPTWSAPHIGADGTKTWGEIATTNPPEKQAVRK